MENLNEILKYAPKKLKLWSELFGCVELYGTDPITIKHDTTLIDYYNSGALHKGGNIDLFPASGVSWKSWTKYLLKKGDVVSQGNTIGVVDSIYNNMITLSPAVMFNTLYCKSHMITLENVMYASPSEVNSLISSIPKGFSIGDNLFVQDSCTTYKHCGVVVEYTITGYKLDNGEIVPYDSTEYYSMSIVTETEDSTPALVLVGIAFNLVRLVKAAEINGENLYKVVK